MRPETITTYMQKSPFLSAKIKRHPEWLKWLGAEKCPELNLAKDKESDDASFMKAIRDFKYYHMLRLAVMDMAGIKPTKDILREWSDVADKILEAAYEYSRNACVRKHGKPLGPEGECKGLVVALGKLGGRELNFSSDVDLIFIYETDDVVTQDKTTAHEFHVELASLFTRLLSTVSEDGFAYRVDHELRPEGKQGSLANSLEALVRYYEGFGRDWERQALIRARAVAGDKDLGERFIEEIRPFVYRRSITVKDISHMRGLKKRMEAHATVRGSSLDIKHGPGGIREAEFLIQAMQTLYGGVHPTLRCTNTFDAIAALAAKALIHPYGAGLLTDAYSFLRRLEDMLQIEGDVQTHSLPKGESDFRGLSDRMASPGRDINEQAANLKKDISRHMRIVERLFHALFEEDYERQELREAIVGNLSTSANEEEAADSLAWFARSESHRIARADLEDRLPLKQVFERLTLTAEVVIQTAFQMAKERVTTMHGEPILEDGTKAWLAVIGLGRLGSREMDYGSDLDICFVYSGDGMTNGRLPISNAEYFTKLARRIIALITLPTRYGRAYAVDSELRPSGRAGTLVTSLQSFVEYHRTQAAAWEHMALLKARALAGNNTFLKTVQDNLTALALGRVPPEKEAVLSEIERLHNRAVAERASKDTNAIDLKFTPGGLLELELAIQFYQLMNAHAHKELWEVNSFEVLDGMLASGVFTEGFYNKIMDQLIFFRSLVSKIRLISHSPTNSLKKDGKQTEAIAAQMGFESAQALLDAVDLRLSEGRKIYSDVIRKY